MRAFHSFWSAPNRGRNGGRIELPDYELLTMMLSALKWEERNGPIRMMTDSPGAAFFREAGLSALWSEGIDTGLDSLGTELDPRLFWAAGKLAALRRFDAPCVMLDTDLIIWRNLDGELRDCVVAAHREELNPSVYPDPRTAFRLDERYAFPETWDFTLPAANTAFLYMPDAELKDGYADAAFRFMYALRNGDIDPVVSMCFAEQRILPMYAHARGVEVRTLLDEHALDEQTFVTHLWGHKQELGSSPERRVAFCLGCVLRILEDFPAWEGVLARNTQTAPYLTELQETVHTGSKSPNAAVRKERA